MSRLKKVAIVGRPNVGKSALFNAICKKRVSIVDDAEGITRDRIYQKTDLFGYPFEIIDTGGIELHSRTDFSKQIKEQAEIAICEADSIILVVDAKSGPNDLDRAVAKILHNQSKPVCLAVNKVDNRDDMHLLHQFASLGIPHMVAVSASHGFQVAELLNTALSSFDKNDIPEEDPELPKIAIIGRPNVGKSMLLNALLGEQRSIVSPIAGTTRDAIDTRITINDREYLLIDTAGIRRKHKEKEVVEKFASIRSQEALDRCDIALLVMDSMQGITAEEKRIARLIEQSGKGCVLLFNKWDLNEGFRMEHCLKGIEQEVPFLSHCPKLFISAKTKRNVDKIFPTVAEVQTSYETRISTHTLNKCLIKAMQKLHPTMIQGKRLRIYYLAQVDVKPPRFVLFVNSPLLMEESYKKYLIHQLRETFEFSGVPLVLELRGKEKKKMHKKPPRPKNAPYDRDLPYQSADSQDDFDDGFAAEDEDL